MSKKVVIVVMLVVIAAVGVFLLARRPTGTEQEQIIAVVSSLTGGLAANGKDMANGAILGFDEARSAGRLPVGIRVELFDDQSDPKGAASVGERVCQDKKIIAVVGHLSSGCTLAAVRTYAREGMPVIMPVPTNPELTESGFANVFRVPPRDDQQAPFLADYVRRAAPDARVAVIHDQTAYGKGFIDSFKARYEADGAKLIFGDGVQAKERDFRTLITKLRESKPTHVVLGATYDMGGPFVRQMKELGVAAAVLSGDGCYGQAFLDQAGSAAEGTIVTFIAPDRNASDLTGDFFRRYEEKYKRVVSYAPLGHDAALVVIEALRLTDEKSRAGLLAALRKPVFTVHGVTGEVAFDAKGDNKSSRLFLYCVRNGAWVSIPGK